jgi:putative FmdB family regulatory protein
MPIYEYRCTGCGRVSEELQRLGAPPVTECAVCHGRLEKLVSAPAFQFKGSGWYVTDYARKSGSGGESKEGSEGSERGGKEGVGEDRDKRSDERSDKGADKGSDDKKPAVAKASSSAAGKD